MPDAPHTLSPVVEPDDPADAHESADGRDHRQLGRQLDLFSSDELVGLSDLAHRRGRDLELRY